MSQQRLFKQVDVFTDRPYFGNALAVVLNGQDLDDEAMQRLARWTNCPKRHSCCRRRTRKPTTA